MLLEVEAGCYRSRARAGTLDQRRQRAVAVRADDETHVLCFLEQLRSETLRHAAGNAHDGRRRHVPLQLAKPADDPLLGMIADRAGIDENDVRTLWTFHRDVPMRRELAEHQLGITHVHLAAVGLDVDRWHGARC